MHRLKNDKLTVTISRQGAALESVIDNQTGHEYIWQGKTAWPNAMPLMFPNTGRLADDQLLYKENLYDLDQNGLAMNAEFFVQNEGENFISFYLKSDAQTQAHYPFEFSLQVTYILHQRTLTVTYELLNPANHSLYYNLGALPHFTVQTEANAEDDHHQDVSFRLDPEGKYLLLTLDDSGYLTNPKKSRYVRASQDHLTAHSPAESMTIYQMGANSELSLTDRLAGYQVVIKPSRFDFMGLKLTQVGNDQAYAVMGPLGALPDEAESPTPIDQRYAVVSLAAHQINTHDYTIDFNRI